MEHKGVVRREGCRIEKLLIRRESEPPIPALLWLPDVPDGAQTKVLYVDGRGKTTDAGPGGPIEQLVAAGRLVLSVDVRGCGETTDPGGDAPYSKGDHRIAMWSLHIGRPLLGQRVEDVLAARRILAERDDVDSAKIELIGVERGGPVALHAAVLAIDSTPRVTLRDSILSWIDGIMLCPERRDAMGHVVPGVLEEYDLPDLVDLLRSRGVECSSADGTD